MLFPSSSAVKNSTAVVHYFEKSNIVFATELVICNRHGYKLPVDACT